MNGLHCPICGKDDGTQMYGVVICKAALAKANAENEHLQRTMREHNEAVAEAKRLSGELSRANDLIHALTKERDEELRGSDASHRILSELGVEKESGPDEMPPGVVLNVTERIRRLGMRRDEAILVNKALFAGDSIPLAHAEKVLVSVAKAAARLGAEDMRREIEVRLRQTGLGHDINGSNSHDYDVQQQEWGLGWGYDAAAQDVANFSIPEFGTKS